MHELKLIREVYFDYVPTRVPVFYGKITQVRIDTGVATLRWGHEYKKSPVVRCRVGGWTVEMVGPVGPGSA